MPRENENIGSEATPHLDGIREGIIKDSTGVQIGLRSDVNHKKDSLRTAKPKDEELKSFEEMMRGDSVD
ncbi:hypothetical protein [Virgibacillus ndiopensis]|uniref:hypothetical protein n=1 Tax=Virgibacillus ndiopensis TaxID=2004408 RepID=UPI000C077B62|nr:hypothetical protein [Virgibacillus ndiopensis]